MKSYNEYKITFQKGKTLKKWNSNNNISYHLLINGKRIHDCFILLKSTGYFYSIYKGELPYCDYTKDNDLLKSTNLNKFHFDRLHWHGMNYCVLHDCIRLSTKSIKIAKEILIYKANQNA